MKVAPTEIQLIFWIEAIATVANPYPACHHFKYQRNRPEFRVTSRDENILLEMGLDNFIVIVYNCIIKDVPFITVVETFWYTVDDEAIESHRNSEVTH